MDDSWNLTQLIYLIYSNNDNNYTTTNNLAMILKEGLLLDENTYCKTTTTQQQEQQEQNNDEEQLLPTTTITPDNNNNNQLTTPTITDDTIITKITNKGCQSHLILRLKQEQHPLYLILLTNTIQDRKSRADVVIVARWDHHQSGGGGGGAGSLLQIILCIPMISTTNIEVERAGVFSVAVGRSPRFYFVLNTINEMWAAIVELRRLRDKAPQSHVDLSLMWVLDENHFHHDEYWVNPEFIDLFTSQTVAPVLGTNVVRSRQYNKPLPDDVRQCVIDFVSTFPDPDMLDTKPVWDHLIHQYGTSIMDKKIGYSKDFVNDALFSALGQMTPASNIVQDKLWLGSRHNAANLSELRNLGITHIVNVTTQVEKFYPECFTYTQIHILDIPAAKLHPHLPRACDFIDEALLKNKKVFVHCQEGVSRSASVVIAWLMRTNRMTFKEALDSVKGKRRIVNPNVGFREQLKIWEQDLNII
jgi:protein-tyrosine phosphatase